MWLQRKKVFLRKKEIGMDLLKVNLNLVMTKLYTFPLQLFPFITSESTGINISLHVYVMYVITLYIMMYINVFG